MFLAWMLLYMPCSMYSQQILRLNMLNTCNTDSLGLMDNLTLWHMRTIIDSMCNVPNHVTLGLTV